MGRPPLDQIQTESVDQHQHEVVRLADEITEEGGAACWEGHGRATRGRDRPAEVDEVRNVRDGG